MAAPAIPASQQPADYLADVCELLWPPPATARLTGRRSSASRSVASRSEASQSGGSQSGGSQSGGRTLIVLPGSRRPALIVPSARRAAAAAVGRYGQPGSTRTKLVTRALAATLAAGAGPVLGDRLVVSVPAGAPDIAGYLGALLGRDDAVEVSMHIRAERANRKPVLQLLTADGATIGFAKIGINPLTVDLVRAERAALTRLGAAGLTQMRLPEVMASGRWNGLEVLVLSALPVWRSGRRLRPGQLEGALAELSRATGTSSGPLVASDYWRQLTGRLVQAPDSTDRNRLSALVTWLGTLAGTVKVTLGCWHGDLTAWNLANTRTGLLVWDWERFSTAVPIGFDALHYWLQSEATLPGSDPIQAAGECIRRAPDLLAHFGVRPVPARVTALAYLAELSVRYLADRQAEAGARLGAPGTWLIPAMDSGLRTYRGD
jgi:hypothetical protein